MLFGDGEAIARAPWREPPMFQTLVVCARTPETIENVCFYRTKTGFPKNAQKCCIFPMELQHVSGLPVTNKIVHDF
jgi:hypothetical protein